MSLRPINIASDVTRMITEMGTGMVEYSSYFPLSSIIFLFKAKSENNEDNGRICFIHFASSE
jgi:hypothetical protein